MKAARKPVPVEKNHWSEQSRVGLAYAFAPEFYEDRPFTCRSCGTKSVFTAEQQKYTYEIKKAYVWEQHVLCQPCFDERNALTAEAAAIAACWVKEKAALASDAEVLRRWKEVLELMPRFGVRKDTARIRMLAKLLQSAT
jgi:Probable zinc-ribbon domain